jgi:predicted MFS family arabinose efflux permease
MWKVSPSNLTCGAECPKPYLRSVNLGNTRKTLEMAVERSVYHSTPLPQRWRRVDVRRQANLAPHPQSSNTVEHAEGTSHFTEFDLGYYGWRVVLAACLGVMAGFGSLFVYTFSVFVKPLAAKFGWSREAISSGFAIAAVTLGLCSPLLGRWIDRYGPRRIVLACMTIYGCAIASLSLLRSGLWQFYVTCFVLGVVGNGAAHLAYSRSISTWFQRRLGMALAFVMVGAVWAP